jgi:hypothetical protein
MYGMKRRLPAWIVSAALMLTLASPAAAQRHAPEGGGSRPAAAPRSAPAPAPAPATNAGRDAGHGQERATSRRPNEKTDTADKSNQSPPSKDNGSTSAARRRGNQPQTGQAAVRTSPPPNGEHGGHGGHGHGGGVAGYPWWSSGYYGGYYAYDPGFGWYPTYDPVSSGGASDVTGAVRLKVKPVDASVYVDGYYVGTVDDFDGVFQRLRLEPGQHHMEIRLPDYDDLSFDVLIQPDQTTTYHGMMHKQE